MYEWTVVGHGLKACDVPGGTLYTHEMVGGLVAIPSVASVNPVPVLEAPVLAPKVAVAPVVAPEPVVPAAPVAPPQPVVIPVVAPAAQAAPPVVPVVAPVVQAVPAAPLHDAATQAAIDAAVKAALAK